MAKYWILGRTVLPYWFRAQIVFRRPVFIDSQLYHVYPLNCGECQTNHEKWYIPVDSFVYLWFWRLQVPFFVHNIKIECCIKVAILVCGWCQVISSKSRYKNRMFPLCFTNIPYFLSASVCQNIPDAFTCVYSLRTSAMRTFYVQLRKHRFFSRLDTYDSAKQWHIHKI